MTTTANPVASAPMHPVVGQRYFTLHTWSKINRRENNASEWFNDHVVPMLGAGINMPKRFMLYMDAQHADLWYRVRHDWEDVWVKSVAAMDARAAYLYASTLHSRRLPNTLLDGHPPLPVRADGGLLQPTDHVK